GDPVPDGVAAGAVPLGGFEAVEAGVADGRPATAQAEVSARAHGQTPLSEGRANDHGRAKGRGAEARRSGTSIPPAAPSTIPRGRTRSSKNRPRAPGPGRHRNFLLPFPPRSA